MPAVGQERLGAALEPGICEGSEAQLHRRVLPQDVAGLQLDPMKGKQLASPTTVIGSG